MNYEEVCRLYDEHASALLGYACPHDQPAENKGGGICPVIKKISKRQ
jgi:hypothetical protein